MPQCFRFRCTSLDFFIKLSSKKVAYVCNVLRILWRFLSIIMTSYSSESCSCARMLLLGLRLDVQVLPSADVASFTTGQKFVTYIPIN